MSKDKVNQQATSHQLAWLAGIWDGEGTFDICRTKRDSYSGRITLSNTDEIMINEIVKIFDSYNINGHIWRETESRKPSHKKAYHFTLNKLQSVKDAVELMLPYLVAKKARAEILMRFIDSRLKYKAIVKQCPVTGKILGKVSQGYNKEISFYEQLRELNTTGIKQGASETNTPDTHEVE